ncbi:MAG: uracil-DNA glycosylase [Sideroxydans sp.]
MNIRDEDVLRELNLYPLWVRRAAPFADLVSTRLASRQSAEPVGPKSDPQEKGDELAGRTSVRQIAPDWVALKQQVRECNACTLRAGCTQTVFGIGDEHADWLFVGEGPGADEDAQGEPFVGQAGKLLDNMLAAIKLKRGDNVYIANVVKCRPPANRNPAADEVATCLPYLQQQIALIQPKLIVALGKTAATALLGREATLGSMRGVLHDFKLPAMGQRDDQGRMSGQCPSIPLIVTYHPAYLLRSPAEKAKAWQDLCLARATLQLSSNGNAE